jgi:SAM-dependent methyltransferase
LELLKEWLSGLKPTERVLDLGAGSGSFDYESCSCSIVSVDLDFGPALPSKPTIRICADSNSLPFAQRSFDLIICHHSLEHFKDFVPSIREIRRVLKQNGKLFVSVPDGYSFSDNLYRFLFAGGGHLQRFSFEQVTRIIQSETVLHLVAWRDLHTSFIYLDKRNFLPAPRGPLPGPFPRRMQWFGRFPKWSFFTAKFLLNVASRLIDRFGNSRLSLYGWALAFDSIPIPPTRERSFVNVCMYCGFGVGRNEILPTGVLFYTCGVCQGLNPLFRPNFEGPFKAV